MIQYIEHQINLSNIQKQKIARALRDNKAIAIKLRSSDLQGKEKIHLTRRQINKIKKCKTKGVGCLLRLSIAQLKYNVKHGSGFEQWLPLIGSVLGPILGTLGKKAVEHFIPDQPQPQQQQQKKKGGCMQ